MRKCIYAMSVLFLALFMKTPVLADEISADQQILNEAIKVYVDLGYSLPEAQTMVQFDLMEQVQDQYMDQLGDQLGLEEDAEIIEYLSTAHAEPVTEEVKAESSVPMPSEAFMAVSEQSSSGTNRWGISLNEKEKKMLCKITYHEAGNQSDYGKMCVIAVVLNRMQSGRFGGHSLYEVLSAPGQFTTWGELNAISASNWKSIMPLVDRVLSGDSTMDGFNYYYFCSGSGHPANARKIGDHYFS